MAASIDVRFVIVPHTGVNDLISNSLRFCRCHHRFACRRETSLLVQDNLLNNRMSAAALCLNLAEVSPRTEVGIAMELFAISMPEIPECLARGGCAGIIGIDAGYASSKSGSSVSLPSHKRVNAWKKYGHSWLTPITPTCAFILDPLNWSEEELEATFRLALTL